MSDPYDYQQLSELVNAELSDPALFYEQRDAALELVRSRQYTQRCIRDQVMAEQAIGELEELFGSDLSQQLTAAGEAAFMQGQMSAMKGLNQGNLPSW